MSGLDLDERTFLMHWGARPLPKRLGGRWRSKVAREATPEYKAREAVRKRARYAANREHERAKARERYSADPKCLARKLRCNMTARQRVRAAKADRRKYERHREKMIAAQVARDRAKRLFRHVLDLIDPPPAPTRSTPVDLGRRALLVSRQPFIITAFPADYEPRNALSRCSTRARAAGTMP